MKSIRNPLLACLAIVTIFSFCQAQAAKLPTVYERAVHCAANARFMLAKEGRVEGQSDMATTRDKARIERWSAFARAVGEVSDARFQRDLERTETAIAKQFQTRLDQSDRVRDDPFSDMIVAGYTDCITRPPADPERLKVYNQLVMCSAWTRFHASAMFRQNQTKLAESGNFLADAMIGSAQAMNIAPREDIEIAHDEMTFKIENAYLGLPPAAQRQYVERAWTESRKCDDI